MRSYTLRKNYFEKKSGDCSHLMLIDKLRVLARSSSGANNTDLAEIDDVPPPSTVVEQGNPQEEANASTTMMNEPLNKRPRISRPKVKCPSCKHAFADLEKHVQKQHPVQTS